MVAFEPYLALGVAGDGSKKVTIYVPYHTYTIPSCRPCRKSAAQVHLPSTDDLTRRFENLFIALACWPTLRALAKAAVSLQATLLQQRQAILGATPRRAEGYSSGVRSDTDARRRDERREAATELPRSLTPPRRRRQKQR